jgi:GT2 family glycosyltransferase
MLISVVICSTDEAKFSAVLNMYAQLLDGYPFEIIHIPDAKGICEGYNRGVSLSRGQIILFSHDDITIHCENFRSRLLSHMDHCDVLGIAGTDRLCNGNWIVAGLPHLFGQVIHDRTDTDKFRSVIYAAPKRRIPNIQAIDGALFCCRREVAQRIPFDQETFPGYHMYDLDFSFRAHLAGYKVAVACDFDVVHSSLWRYDQAWETDSEAFSRKHAAHLAPAPQQFCQLSFVVTLTLQEALAVLRPPFWED